MLLRLNGDPSIEDLRNHTVECVERLRALLRAGAPARPDPRRRDFYEVDDFGRVFYIHITPRGRVLLLATWLKDSPETEVDTGRLAIVPRALKNEPWPRAIEQSLIEQLDQQSSPAQG